MQDFVNLYYKLIVLINPGINPEICMGMDSKRIRLRRTEYLFIYFLTCEHLLGVLDLMCWPMELVVTDFLVG